jgi:hypothetical protein
MTLRLSVSSIFSNISNIFVNLLLTLIAFFRKTSPIAVATLLHNGAAMTKMLYAIEVWCSPICEPAPGKKKKRGSISFTTKLAHVQCTSTIFTMGALHSTPTVALDTHTFILPMHLTINKACQRAALHFTTLPHTKAEHESA